MTRWVRPSPTLGVAAALLGALLWPGPSGADARQPGTPVIPLRGPVHLNGRTWTMEVSPLGAADIEIAFGVNAPARLSLGTGGRGTPPDASRPNLYLVGPGRDWTIEGRKADHNRVLDQEPQTPDFIEVDLYAAVVLDPALKDVPMTSAGALIDYHLTSFLPAERYGPELAPGKDALLTFFHLNQERFKGLEQHLNPDGTYPRVLVWPLRVAIKARFSRP